VWSLHLLNFVTIAGQPLMKHAFDRQDDPALMPPPCDGIGVDQSTDPPESTAIVEIADEVLGCRNGRRKILGIDCRASGESIPAPDAILRIGLIAAAATQRWIPFRVGLRVGCMA
jgi:hypothetical protein